MALSPIPDSHSFLARKRQPGRASSDVSPWNNCPEPPIVSSLLFSPSFFSGACFKIRMSENRLSLPALRPPGLHSLSLSKVGARASYHDEATGADKAVVLELCFEDGSKRELRATSSETISQIKYRMQVDWGIPFVDTVLMLSEKKLLDPLSLSDYVQFNEGSADQLRVSIAVTKRAPGEFLTLSSNTRLPPLGIVPKIPVLVPPEETPEPPPEEVTSHKRTHTAPGKASVDIVAPLGAEGQTACSAPPTANREPGETRPASSLVPPSPVSDIDASSTEAISPKCLFVKSENQPSSFTLEVPVPATPKQPPKRCQVAPEPQPPPPRELAPEAKPTKACCVIL